MANFPIKGLDFPEIKKNFISYLKNDSYFSDYNYEASGISALINILAYNTHYIGYYIKAALSESFVDSASKRNTLMSRAKWNGYIPRNKRSSRAEVTLAIRTNTTNEPLSRSLMIPKWSLFSGANSQSDARSFYILDDVVCYDRVASGSVVTYTSPQILVYEGIKNTWRFIKDSSILNQRFIIKDTNIDIDTIRVDVYTDESNRTAFSRVTNLFEISPLSEVFYVSANVEGTYEIFFGNNQFGKDVSNGDIIEVTYLSSNGESGNGCKTMVFQSPSSPIVSGSVSYVTTVLSMSVGGVEEESIDDLKFNIPYHYRRQNRAVVESDYRSILLSEFRDVDSVNIWGGEKSFNKNYNTVYISVKPKIGLTFNASAKKDIARMLEAYSVINKTVQIVDPEYLKVGIEYHAKFNQQSTSASIGEIQRSILTYSKDYNNAVLDRFENGLSDVDLLNFIKSKIPSLTRIYTKKTLTKDVSFLYNSNTETNILFGNSLKPSSLISSVFVYGRQRCEIKDDSSGKLFIYMEGTWTKFIPLQVGSIDYDAGIVKITLNFYFTATVDYGSSGIVSFTGIPVIPDINTYLNNIIIIDSAKTVISYA